MTKYAFATRVGFIPDNTNKVNQDSYLLQPNFNKSPYCHLFGVCDGHGSNGHTASQFVRDSLPKLLEQIALKTAQKSKNDFEIPLVSHEVYGNNSTRLLSPKDALANFGFLDVTQHFYTPCFTSQDYQTIFKEAFLQCDAQLLQTYGSTMNLSGTTVVMILYEGTRLIVANAGDSRVIRCQLF